MGLVPVESLPLVNGCCNHIDYTYSDSYNDDVEGVTSAELEKAAIQMRRGNILLITSSIRTIFSCFHDIDLSRFEPTSDYMIHFKSMGTHKYPGKHSMLRPVSIRWPSSFEEMARALSQLDSHLVNSKFKENPAAWMIKKNLTKIPTCKQCSRPMVLTHDENQTQYCWTCTKTGLCTNYSMPIQRPSFFRGFETVSISKLLFSVYYWATATHRNELQAKLNLEYETMDLIWRRFQNVCRTALESHQVRLHSTSADNPIDLVSMKFRDIYILCAKSSDSNLVRLGLHIPDQSRYSYTELTENWFARGSVIRTAEEKFLPLRSHNNLTVNMVSRRYMMSKNGSFDPDSAFGYAICQLAHIFKDFDSNSITNEGLKLVLAELQWREIFGTTPYDAFTNIVAHMSRYGESSDWYSEPALPVNGEETITTAEMVEEAFTSDDREDKNQIFAEHYFYATNVPTKKDPPVETLSCMEPDVRFKCHLCFTYLNNYQFAKHHVTHVEKSRIESRQSNFIEKSGIFECKHCFRLMDKQALNDHYDIFRADIHTTLYGCRICCMQLSDRATYLQHMRRLHFESEVPYRCPLCKFASSYQRLVFIHFQEVHKSKLSAICPFCLRSFTIRDSSKMTQLSEIVNDHMNLHYALSRTNSCSNCCCTFLSQQDLADHKRLSHNPLKVPDPDVEIQTNVITPELEKYCVKALLMELFVANKKPNLKNSSNQEKLPSESPPDSVVDISSDEDDNQMIHVRGSVSSQFLEGGKPSLIENPRRKSMAQTNSDDKLSSSKSCINYTSSKIIEFMSKMLRADGILPDQSVLITNAKKVTKCFECSQYITMDHFTEEIFCNTCKFSTHCPRSMLIHKEKHQD